MSRRRLAPLLLVLIGALVLAVTAAWAGNPHFLSIGKTTLVYGGTSSSAAATLKTTSSAPAPTGDPRVLVEGIVVVGVKEGVTVSLTAPYQAVYVCVNGGGNVPSAANKTVLTGQMTTSGLFQAGRNGRATGSLLTGPLPSSEEAAEMTGFACPSGQQLEFDRVIFSGLVLSVAGGASVPLDAVLVSTSVHGLT